MCARYHIALTRFVPVIGRFQRQWSGRKLAIGLAVIFLGCRLAGAGPVGVQDVQPDSGTPRFTNALPAKITTTDGVTYNAPRLTRVEPDGLLVEFQPGAGGTGLAKLKFAKLPASLQKQFDYDPRKAADYEHQETLATEAFTQKLQEDAKAGSAALALQSEQSPRPKPAGAVTVSSSDPVVTYTYYTPDQKPALLGSNYVATCRHSYQCHCDFDVQVEPGGDGGQVHFYITKATISLGMSCNLIEAEDPYDFIRLHEEGRRKIVEYFYGLGPQVADRIGETMIGREYTSRDVDYENTKARVLSEAEAQVAAQYAARLNLVVWEADSYYEKLTGYDGNNVDRNQAAQEACDKFGKEIQN